VRGAKSLRPELASRDMGSSMMRIKINYFKSK
jgi:hypothetical protein